MKIIFPRSPRELMSGWVHLPRLVDKIRLQLAGRLHADYQENYLTHGFDALWFEKSGISSEALVEVVKQSITDGEIADWVQKNCDRSEAQKSAFKELILSRGKTGEESIARLRQRKAENGLSDRNDIECFVDFIDVDEKRRS